MLHTGYVWSHSVETKHFRCIMFLHMNHELTYLTCFDRYWLRLWILSTCRDMVPSDDRVSSKFSIVSSVVIYNENEFARFMSTYSDLLLSNWTIKLITHLPNWGCITKHTHVHVTSIKSCPHVSRTNSSGSGWNGPFRRRGVMTFMDGDAATGTAQLSPGATFPRPYCCKCCCVKVSSVSYAVVEY